MKIAIIEYNLKLKEKFQKLFNDTDWDVDFYSNMNEIFTFLKRYDVIIADIEIHGIIKIMKFFADKTSAQLFLMGEYLNGYSEEFMNSKHIVGFIEKDKFENFVSEMKFVDSKLKIKKAVYKEERNCEFLGSYANEIRLKTI